MKQVSIRIDDPSFAGAARRTAAAMAQTIGLDETRQGRVAIIATEMANNLLTHAKRGELLLRPLSQEGTEGIELLAIDRGPGMANVARCLVDGYSTAGTPGTGLGAIQRLSDCFDIHSGLDHGTVLLAHVWHQNGTQPPLNLGAVCLPMAGEEMCGDAWTVIHRPEGLLLMVADGLGHGPLASMAAQEAVRICRAHASSPISAIVPLIHAGLRLTRGAVLSLAVWDQRRGTLQYAGIGNISGSIFTPTGMIRLPSQNGTVGYEIPTPRVSEYQVPADGLIILHSDGLTAQWRLDRYPGLIRRHPSIIAATLYRDFKRGNDDSTVLVIKGPEAAG